MVLLVKLLVLKMLLEDNEPLNIILEEAFTEDKRNLLKKGYQDRQITKEKIKQALTELKDNYMITLQDEKGKELSLSKEKFDEILNSNAEWTYWFRITKDGEKLFYDNYLDFFDEAYVR